MKMPDSSSAFAIRSDARPLRAWSAQQQRRLQEVLQQTLLEWQTAWALAPAGAAAASVELEAQAASDSDQVLWHLESSVGADQTATPRGQVDPLSILGEQLFGLRASPPAPAGVGPTIALNVVGAAWADWLQRLSAALAAPVVAHTSTDNDAAASIWTGALQARMTWCSQTFCLLLPGVVLAHLLPAAPVPASPVNPLTRLDDALHGESLNLQVRLDDVTLTLGELEHLQSGDLVLLSHRLDAPLHLVGPHNQALCSAWLGQRDGRVAVELSALATPALSNLHPV